jgi:hypothetical protein
MKDEDEESEKLEKNWVDGEALHFITLRRKMKLEFSKNAKNDVNFYHRPFILFSTLKP